MKSILAKPLVMMLILGGYLPAMAVLSNQVEIRSFAEQKLAYDKNYYTDMGLDVRFSNSVAEFQIKRGVVFSALRKPFEIGNHEWYYTNYNVSVLVGECSVSAEVLGEINPFEGNDFSISKQITTQSNEITCGNFSYYRGKYTNGDFYSSASYSVQLDRWFTITEASISTIGEGKRGAADIIRFWNDEIVALEAKLSHWWIFDMGNGLKLALRGQYFTRQYFEGENLIGYSISMGVIAQ